MRASTILLGFCIAGFVFLYAPILSLIVFSFNESKLVTVWGGFSTKWYVALFQDPQILGAVWISLQVSVAAATLAVVLGTLVLAWASWHLVERPLLELVDRRIARRARSQQGSSGGAEGEQHEQLRDSGVRTG